MALLPLPKEYYFFYVKMIYNITPPEKICDINKILTYHRQLIYSISPEMIGIYDIVKEKARNNKPRTYTYKDYMNTYEFAKLMKYEFPSIPLIIYRSVKENETYDTIIDNIRENQLNFPNVVVVGNSLNPTIHTNTLIKKIKEECSVNIGCVLLYDRPDEMNYCILRIKLGVSFFITQIVTKPEKIMTFIEQLPVKIYVTIVPIENAKTMEMINWLCGNETNNIDDLQSYPNDLIKANIKHICFESISSISSTKMVDFIQRFKLW